MWVLVGRKTRNLLSGGLKRKGQRLLFGSIVMVVQTKKKPNLVVLGKGMVGASTRVARSSAVQAKLAIVPVNEKGHESDLKQVCWKSREEDP